MKTIQLAQLDLNLLTTLDALLRHGSVRAAARELQITQSAMSHRLRRLREAFDDPLLAPGRKGLVATSRALELKEPLREALAHLALAIQLPEPFDPATSQRAFTLCCPDMTEFAIMPQFLELLGERAPHVQLVTVPPRTATPELLESGAIDLAFANRGIDAGGLKQRRILREPFVVISRRSNPGLRRGFDLESFLALPHLLIAPRGTPGGIVDTALAKLNRNRRIALRIPNFAPAPFIVARSDLLATVPRTLAHAASRYLDLRVSKPPIELPETDSFMMWHERFDGDPGHRWLRDLVNEVAGSLATRPRRLQK